MKYFFFTAPLLKAELQPHIFKRVMIKEKQRIENKSSSSSSEGGDPGTGDDNQMIKTPDNNSGDLHHDLDSIIKTETDMTALIDNTGGDVTDTKNGVGGGSASSNASPGSSNNDQKQQMLSNDMCLNQSMLLQTF